MAVFRAGIFNRYCYPLNMHVRDGRTPNPTIARHLKVEKFGVLPTKLIGHHLRFLYGWGNFKIDLTIQMVPHVPQPVGHHRPYKFYRVRIHALERVPHRMAGRAERWPGVANPGKSPLDPPTWNGANTRWLQVLQIIMWCPKKKGRSHRTAPTDTQGLWQPGRIVSVEKGTLIA